jgi:hypothetical protein
MDGEDVSSEHLKKWIMIFKARWRTAIVLEVPTVPGEFLVKWWRHDDRGGKVARVNVEGTKILILPDDIQAALNEKTKKIRLDNLVESTAVPGGNTRRLQRMPRSGDKDSRRCKRRSDADGDETGSDDDAANDDNKSSRAVADDGMTDTYIAVNSVPAAFCAAGSACRAVDIVVACENTNAFVCTRPPGHHAGRYGCTLGCISTGFCLLNNAAIAMVYSRVRWGFDRVAVVDFDVHMGNGTAELLQNDPRAFFATVCNDCAMSIMLLFKIYLTFDVCCRSKWFTEKKIVE